MKNIKNRIKNLNIILTLVNMTKIKQKKEYSIKFIHIMTKKYSKRNIKRLEFYTGYKMDQLYTECNPIWYINISFFLLGIILQLKFDILKHLREDFVNIWKPLLGWHYYAEWKRKEQLIDNRIAFNFRQDDMTNPHDDTPKIADGTIYNRFWQYIYVKLIQLRLWIMGNFYLYTIFHITLTFWLITNQHLLLASIISILLLTSRMAIHASDYSMHDLRYVINMIEKMEEDEVPAPTHLNAEIIALVATRSFHRRRLNEYAKKDWKTTGSDLFLSINITTGVFYKYNELYPGYLTDYNNMLLYVHRIAEYEDANDQSQRNGLDPIEEAHLIEAWEKNTNKRYKKVLKIIKKNAFPKTIIGVSALEIAQDLKEPLKKIKNMLKGMQNTNNNKLAVFESVQIKTKNSKANDHPVTLYFDEVKKTLARTNSSTLRKNYTPETHKIPTDPESGRGEVVHGVIKQLTEQETKLLEQELTELNEKCLLKKKEHPLDYIPVFKSESILNTDVITLYYEHCSRKSSIIQPDCIFVKEAFLNFKATKQQALNGAEESLKYYETLLKASNGYKEKKIKQDCLEEINMVKKIINEIKTNDKQVYSETPDELMQIHLDNLIKINQDLNDNKSIPVIVNVKNTLGNLFDMHPSIAGSRHLSNLDLIKKPDGGEIDTKSKKAIKRLLETEIYE